MSKVYLNIKIDKDYTLKSIEHFRAINNQNCWCQFILSITVYTSKREKDQNLNTNITKSLLVHLAHFFQVKYDVSLDNFKFLIY